jgi:hypothetical protein
MPPDEGRLKPSSAFSTTPVVEPRRAFGDNVGLASCSPPALVWHIRAEGDDGVLHRVGRAHAWCIHMGLATNHGESLLDIFDAHSQPMCDLSAALFDPETDYFTAAIIRQFEAMDCDLLILDYVILNPCWRGLKLGLLAARQNSPSPRLRRRRNCR